MENCHNLSRDDEFEWYEALIKRYSGYIYSIIFRIAGRRATREDIEECTADVLVAVWRARDAYDPEKGDYDHYVAAIARNKAINLCKKLSRAKDWVPLNEDVLELDIQLPLDQIVQSELSALLGEAIETLEPPSPEIFMRRYYWGDALSEIADALGLTKRAVEGRLYRGRQQLKVWLERRL